MSEETIINNLINAVRDLTDSVAELQEAAKEYTNSMRELNETMCQSIEHIEITGVFDDSEELLKHLENLEKDKDH